MDARRLARFGHKEADRRQTEHIHVHKMDLGVVVGERGEKFARRHSSTVKYRRRLERAIFGSDSKSIDIFCFNILENKLNKKIILLGMGGEVKRTL